MQDIADVSGWNVVWVVYLFSCYSWMRQRLQGSLAPNGLDYLHFLVVASHSLDSEGAPSQAAELPTVISVHWFSNAVELFMSNVSVSNELVEEETWRCVMCVAQHMRSWWCMRRLQFRTPYVQCPSWSPPCRSFALIYCLCFMYAQSKIFYSSSSSPRSGAVWMNCHFYFEHRANITSLCVCHLWYFV